MQLFSTITAAIVATAAMVFVIAEQEVHIKLHVSRDKFYVTPSGQQCYFNSCIDPSVYPCANGSVCVIDSYSHGLCKDPKDPGAKQNYNDPKMKCPYPNPYNSPKSER